MKVRLRWICFGLLAGGISIGHSLELPTPPQQAAEWRAPPGLPTNLLSAASTLFAQGFPDPRGCEYREIEIVTGDVWRAGTNATATRGWVLPPNAGESNRFAICWNGLIYPLRKSGELADLHAEIAATEAARQTGRMYFYGGANAVGESRSVQFASAQSTKVLLLLRTGETAAALTNYALLPRSNVQTFRRPGERPDNAAGEPDPYLQFAGDWAWALFDRTLCAHMRGDEALALATARTLAQVQPRIEAEAARRGFPRQLESSFRPSDQRKEKPYLDFLAAFPVLLTDLERREREGVRLPVLQRGLTNIANPTDRISALIRDLDLVAARQMGQPGWVIVNGDPIVAALIQEGDPAVEPLLDCLETDKRLTRSVGFGRDFHRNRTVVPVNSAARTALLAILQANFSTATEMRAYWSKYKHLKLEERWYQTLRDDAAGMGRWLEAASLITQPTNQWRQPGSGYSMEWPAPTNGSAALRGNVLRGKADPSVAELLARRATEIAPTNPASYDLSAACTLGMQLAVWDAPASWPVLGTLTERCEVALEYSSGGRSPSSHAWGPLLAKLLIARVDAGDRAKIPTEKFAAWLPTSQPEFGSPVGEIFAPLWKFPADPNLQMAAEEMFSNTNSAWSQWPWKLSGFYNPLDSGLVRVPAFRLLLARELDRREPYGTVQWHAPNSVSIQTTNGSYRRRALDIPETDRPVDGERVAIRRCDWLALSLGDAKQIPAFNPFAAEATRDQAIAAAKAALTKP